MVIDETLEHRDCCIEQGRTVKLINQCPSFVGRPLLDGGESATECIERINPESPAEPHPLSVIGSLRLPLPRQCETEVGLANASGPAYVGLTDAGEVHRLTNHIASRSLGALLGHKIPQDPIAHDTTSPTPLGRAGRRRRHQGIL